MQEDNFLENLVSKMIKSAHNKNDSAFASLKTVFVKNIEKEQNKNLLVEFDNYQNSLNNRLASCNKDFFGLKSDKKEFDYLRQALKIDKWARAVESRWSKLSHKEKAKFLSIKSDNAELGYKYSAQEFTNVLEGKRQELQKNGILVSREAFYELIRVGYKAENISKKDQSYILPVLGKKTKLVFNSGNDFKEYLKKHENNFNSDINRIMEC